MTPDFCHLCLFYQCKGDLECIKTGLLKASNAAQIYEIGLRAISTKQGTRPVTEYVNELKGLWQELDHYMKIKLSVKNANDATKLTELVA